MTADQPIHAGCVAFEEGAALLLGASGAGKSDLALRLIDGGARLVSDDRTLLEVRGRALWASPPRTIAGRLEIRGAGLIALPHLAEARLVAAFDLDQGEKERLPSPRHFVFDGARIPCYGLDPREASAAAKVRAVTRAEAKGMWRNEVADFGGRS